MNLSGTPYKRILALDFEMYNASHYWSICWIGAVMTDGELNATGNLNILVNPGTRHRLVGKDMKFPFNYGVLKKQPFFDIAAQSLFPYLELSTLVLGHAVDNDVKMLLTACSKYGLDCPDFDYIDTNAVYGALKGNYAQMGLAALADEYKVVFSQHDPVEDATATLSVFKKMLEEKNTSLAAVMSDCSMTAGKVRGGIARKMTLGCMSGKTRQHIDNYNAVFDAAQTARSANGALRGKKIAIDSKLRSSQDLSRLVKWICENGGKIVYDPETANRVICSELTEGDKKHLCLRDFAALYRVPPSAREGLNFFINKVTSQEGETLNYFQYLRKKYPSPKNGKVYCFSRGVERRFDFEDLASKVLCSGGQICSLPQSGCIFVTDGKEKGDESDIKTRTYRRLKKEGKIKTIALDMLKIV